VENSGVGGSNSNTRSSGSIARVFMFYVKTLLVARVQFTGVKSSTLSEQ
jgi:hypothetical protein